ncbi:tetratricopeptide repeat protein [Pseudoalteromonas tunicata]|uniref:tetratricopeptide repeat protein n=1 Tax=Pseudoalteromonas tunicata TaxID=314281 RepID=UPI00273FAE06|nr:tetratricopeptide repeat protein [Pseudoalteromonas tunicata]MDP5213806.1 tetratricopeptide repeat protein [Pseudoalteromonas tunicata]
MLFFKKHKFKPEFRFWFLFLFSLNFLSFSSNHSIALSQHHLLAGKMGVAAHLISHNAIPIEIYQNVDALKHLAGLKDKKAVIFLAEHYERTNQLDLAEFYFIQLQHQESTASEQAKLTLSQFYQRHQMWQKLAEFSQLNGLTLDFYLSQLYLGSSLPQVQPDVFTDLKRKFKLDFTLQIDELSFSQQTHCGIKVVPIATDFKSLKQLKQHVSTFKSDEDLHELPVCFSNILYLSKQVLSCTANEAIKCDLSYLAQQQNWPEGIRHLVIMTSDGSANVNQGIMYLSAKHDFNVFKHEWLHLFGFEDEYPLPIKKQQQRCRLSTSTLSQLVMQERTASVAKNLFPIPTCNAQTVQAYKLVERPTLMQYLDSPMPKRYKTILNANIAHHLGELKTFSNAMYNLDEASYWLAYGVKLGDYHSKLFQALKFETQRDFARALNELSALVNWSMAYSSLARIYYQFEDFEQARHFYGLAAEQGDSYGQYFYAKMLANGEGGPKDQKSAIRYLNHAAAQANPLAIQLINLAPF